MRLLDVVAQLREWSVEPAFYRFVVRGNNLLNLLHDLFLQARDPAADIGEIDHARRAVTVNTRGHGNQGPGRVAQKCIKGGRVLTQLGRTRIPIFWRLAASSGGSIFCECRDDVLFPQQLMEHPDFVIAASFHNTVSLKLTALRQGFILQFLTSIFA